MSSISVQLPTFSMTAPRGAAPLASAAAGLWHWAVKHSAEARRRRDDRAALAELQQLIETHQWSQPSLAADLRAAIGRSETGRDA